MCEYVIMPHDRGLSFEEFNAIFRCIQNPATNERYMWRAEHLPPKDCLDEREFWTVIYNGGQYDVLQAGIEDNESVSERVLHYVKCSVKWGGTKEDHAVHLYCNHGDFDQDRYVMIGDTYYEKSYYAYLKHLGYLSMHKSTLLRCRRRPTRSFVIVIEGMRPGLDRLHRHHQNIRKLLRQEGVTDPQIDQILA